jgi:putative ABC transport system permease protein
MIAGKMMRHRPGTVVATLVALAVGAMILTALGILVETGLTAKPGSQRYAATDLVVANQETTFSTKTFDGDTESTTLRLPEDGTVPVTLAEQLRRVPGVATAVADQAVPVVAAAAGAPATGHGWASAALGAYTMVEGSEPTRGDQVVLDSRLAAGVRPGGETTLVVDGVAGTYRVSGIARSAQPVATTAPAPVFFTDARIAELTPHRGRAVAVGVTLAPGADSHAVTDAIGPLAAKAGARVYAGDERGRTEPSEDLAAKDFLIVIGASMGGYVIMLVIFVVAGTIGLSVRHRRRDLALLRAIAATPGQVRAMVTVEAAILGTLGALLGVPAGFAASHWLRGELVDRKFLPETFPIAPGLLAAVAAALLTVVVAVSAALLAARRVTRIRPVEALGDAAAEPAGNSRGRLISGLIVLALAVTTSGAAATLGASGAAAAAVGMLYLFVTAAALLAPWINRTAARLLTPVLRTVFGPSGHLAGANLRANATGMATVLTALVLSIGFGGSVWFLQDNLERATIAQSRDGVVAQSVLTSPAGLPASAVAEARALPGVTAATGVIKTSVMAEMFAGEAETYTAQAVDPAGLDRTLDLKTTGGSLAALDDKSLAVSSSMAGMVGWKLGETVTLRLGDGVPATLKVAAVYDRGLGFGDLTLSRGTVAGHTAGDAVGQILIAAEPGTDLSSLAGRYPGSVLTGKEELTGAIAADMAISAWLNKLLVGVMVGYAVLAAANTMVMAALARRRELALLRIVGVTRRQAQRMVNAEQTALLGTALVLGITIAATTLTLIVNAVTGNPLPYVPPLGIAAILGGAALLALATTVAPIGHLLRVPPLHHLGTKE